MLPVEVDGHSAEGGEASLVTGSTTAVAADSLTLTGNRRTLLVCCPPVGPGDRASVSSAPCWHSRRAHEPPEPPTHPAASPTRQSGASRQCFAVVAWAGSLLLLNRPPSPPTQSCSGDDRAPQARRTGGEDRTLTAKDGAAVGLGKDVEHRFHGTYILVFVYARQIL